QPSPERVRVKAPADLRNCTGKTQGHLFRVGKTFLMQLHRSRPEPRLSTFERCWLGGATGRVRSPWRSGQATCVRTPLKTARYRGNAIVGRLAASYRWRHSWQHAIESHAATNGGFIPGDRRSRILPLLLIDPRRAALCPYGLSIELLAYLWPHCRPTR